jgi:hypothetical protein
MRTSSFKGITNVFLEVYPKLLRSAIFYLLIVTLGMLFFIVPGISLMISALGFAPMIICFNSKSPISDSRETVKGYWWFSVLTLTIPLSIIIYIYELLRRLLVSYHVTSIFTYKALMLVMSVVFNAYFAVLVIVLFMTLHQNQLEDEKERANELNEEGKVSSFIV